MKIENIRLGFACNSSSSHSILLLADDKDGAVLHDMQGGDEDTFGWNYFTAGTQESKQAYLALCFVDSLRGELGTEAAIILGNHFFGVELEKEVSSWDGKVYLAGNVDHQSQIIFPATFTGEVPHIGFVKAFTKFMMQPNVVIAGGNDNDGEPHFLEPSAVDIINLPTEGKGTSLRARDNGNGSWTLFRTRNGVKTRVRFNNDDIGQKPQAPELVDVKITDQCAIGVSKGCSKYCYQGSTPEGAHADRSYLMSIARQLAHAEVFEVAIGGGEPTEHPDIIAFIDSLSMRHVIPNMTTRNVGWLIDNPTVANKLGAVAISVHSPSAINDTFIRLREAGISCDITFQCIAGVVSTDVLIQMLDTVAEINRENWGNEIRLTILGYKETNTGKLWVDKRKECDVLAALSNCESRARWSTAVDTALLRQIGIPALIAAGFSRLTYHLTEGETSCYIDAVKGKIGPSSYSNDTAMLDLENPDDFLTQFQNVAVEGVSTGALFESKISVTMITQ